MEKERVIAIVEWPLPRSVKDVQIFLGFTGFYRRFIKAYAKIVTPLTDVLKKGQPSTFQLTPSQQEAFAKLKALFTTAPLLRHYDPKLPIRLETDASDFAIGMVMTQLYEGRWHPVAYMSRKLKGAELRYGTPDAELLAIIEAFRTWRHYLSYVQYTIEVLTDHLNHRYLASKPQLNSRQAHWLQELASYDFKIEYRPGTRNPADGLSRRPDLKDDISVEEARQALLPDFLSRFLQTPTGGSEQTATLLLGQGLGNQSQELSNSVTTELTFPTSQDLEGWS